MKTTTQQTTRRSFIAMLLLVFATLLPQTVQAADNHTYAIAVTFHRYDGQSGHDHHGNHLYRAKVAHGHSVYYIYLHSPLPQLKGHMHQKVTVIVSRNTDRWLTLSVHGNSARIHKVVRIHTHH